MGGTFEPPVVGALAQKRTQFAGQHAGTAHELKESLMILAAIGNETAQSAVRIMLDTGVETYRCERARMTVRPLITQPWHWLTRWSTTLLVSEFRDARWVEDMPHVCEVSFLPVSEMGHTIGWGPYPLPGEVLPWMRPHMDGVWAKVWMPIRQN